MRSVFILAMFFPVLADAAIRFSPDDRFVRSPLIKNVWTEKAGSSRLVFTTYKRPQNYDLKDKRKIKELVDSLMQKRNELLHFLDIDDWKIETYSVEKRNNHHRLKLKGSFHKNGYPYKFVEWLVFAREEHGEIQVSFPANKQLKDAEIEQLFSRLEVQ